MTTNNYSAAASSRTNETINYSLRNFVLDKVIRGRAKPNYVKPEIVNAVSIIKEILEQGECSPESKSLEFKLPPPLDILQKNGEL